MSDENLYSIIADELEHGKTDRIVWTRAMGESGGDSDKTKAAYIRLRLADLKKTEQHVLRAEELSIKATAAEGSAISAHNGLFLLRGELAETLQNKKISSFYSVLGITPEATDTAVASAIAEYEYKVHNGTAQPTPEFKYAKETLGNAKARETYDRRLFERMTIEATSFSRNHTSIQNRQIGSESVVLSLWESRKASVIVGAVALFVVGYMLLGFYKEREVSAARKKAIDAQILETTKAAEVAATHAESERALVVGVVNNNEKIIDNSSQQSNRSLNIQQDTENRHRQELEYRANARAQILQMQRENQDRQLALQEQRQRESQQRSEEMRVTREKRYWACMNAALDRMDAATAGSRCSGYQ